jgi:hypothetical protein
LRKEVLTVSEAKRLPMEDVVAIFTVRELIHTSQISSMEGDVSARVRSHLDNRELAPTDAGVTQPTFAPSITSISNSISSISQLVEKEMSDWTPSPGGPPSPSLKAFSSPPDSGKAAAIPMEDEDLSDAVQLPDDARRALSPIPPPEGPLDLVEDEPALPEPEPSSILPPPRLAKLKIVERALSNREYEKAVDGMTFHMMHTASLAPVVADWANSHVSQRGVGSMRLLVSALLSRAAYDGSFGDAAISILTQLRRDIGPTVRDLKESKGRTMPRGSGLIDGLVQNTAFEILRMPSTQTADTYNTDSVRIIMYKAHERSLPDKEYSIRRRNADIFVGKLLHCGFLKPHHVCECFTASPFTPSALLDRLTVLGPFLDRVDGARNLDSLLRRHEERSFGMQGDLVVLQVRALCCDGSNGSR